MVAIMSGADNGFFYAGQVMHFSSPFTVFLIYHKQTMLEKSIFSILLALVIPIWYHRKFAMSNN